MEVVRILGLDSKYYDRRKQRFRDLVYKNSSLPDTAEIPDNRGGFSVVDTLCVRNSSVDFHVHVKQYYRTLFGLPCALWRFDTDIFDPPSPELIPDLGSTGDPCHRNMHNVSDNRLKRKYRKAESGSAENGVLQLCYDGSIEDFTPEALPEALLALSVEPLAKSVFGRVFA
jgi:hypothetical protein